jgi:hypothetical protein
VRVIPGPNIAGTTDWHHIAMTSGNATTYSRGTVDGVNVDIYNWENIPIGPTMIIGYAWRDTWPRSPVCYGGISHVAVHDYSLTQAQILDRYRIGSAGGSGDRSHERVNRILDYAGWPAADRAIDVGGTQLLTAAEMLGRSPLDVLGDTARAEGGVVYIDGSGVLHMHARTRRWGSIDPAAVLPMVYMASPPQLTFDDADLSAAGNVIEIRSTGEPESHAGHVHDPDRGLIPATGASMVVKNQSSVTKYGTYRTSLDAPLPIADARRVAEWRCNTTGGTPLATSGGIETNLSSVVEADTALAESMLNLSVSSLLRLDELPAATFPAEQLDLWVEGWRERIDLTGHTIEWQASRADWDLTVSRWGAVGWGSTRWAY